MTVHVSASCFDFYLTGDCPNCPFRDRFWHGCLSARFARDLNGYDLSEKYGFGCPGRKQVQTAVRILGARRTNLLAGAACAWEAVLLGTENTDMNLAPSRAIRVTPTILR